MRLDKTVPGGAYIRDGVVVDANGNLRPGWTVQDGRAVNPDEQSTQSAVEQPSDSDGADQTAAPPAAGGKRGKNAGASN